jgi:hypothetical protein
MALSAFIAQSIAIEGKKFASGAASLLGLKGILA